MTKAIVRVPTGVTTFDNLIDGGFKRNSINLAAGTAGSGKTIFAVQFLVNGIAKYNETAIYITFEEKKENSTKTCSNSAGTLKNTKKQENSSSLNTHQNKSKKFSSK